MKKRILIVRTDRVGDVVMITPMIRELRRTYPDAFIATLTRPNNLAILQNNPNLDLCLTDDLTKETFWKVVKEIRKHKFTDALLVLPTERAAYQLFFAGIKNRIGVGRKLYEVITFMKSVSRNNYIPLRHEADYCMDLARRIGVKTDNIQPEIFLTEGEKTDAKKFLKSKGVSETDFVLVIHTGTKGSAPNWSEKKYLELVKEIFGNFDMRNIKLFLTALEMTDEFLSGVSKINKEYLFRNSLNKDIVIDISNELGSLRDLIKFLSQTDLLVCPSTGPIHLADAMNISCIGLHCRRNVSSAAHWGVINSVSENLEVSEENCKKFCSADQKTCGIESGLEVSALLNAMNRFFKS
ncbi:MAG: glycosyltransferase family 9 protein [Ignavibacteriaceae bacterium]